MPAQQNITKESVKKFKSDVVGACPSLVTLNEQRIVRDIPDDIFENVLRSVFNGDVQLARDVMYNRFDRIDYESAEKEVESISTLMKASEKISKAIESNQPLLVISDIDNDGSLAQALSMEFKRTTRSDGVYSESRDYDPSNHGFSVAQINNWIDRVGLTREAEFTVLVSDLGTNQRDTQTQFLEDFPNANLIIADHHKPDVDMVVKHEHPRSLLVSPFVKGSMQLALRGGGGVSGGYLTYSLLKNALISLQKKSFLISFEKRTELGGDVPMGEVELKNRMGPMKAMGEAANLLDYVRCDIRLKPLHEKEVEKALSVSSLTRSGRSVGKWITQEQQDNINNLSDVISSAGVDELSEVRAELMRKNHLGYALFKTLKPILEGDPEESNSINVALEVSKILDQEPVEESADVNYIEALRPYVFNFHYENQFEGSVKNAWLSLAKSMMRDVDKLERSVIKKIRDYQLVNQISTDFVAITQASSPSVKKAFTSRQISRAYHSVTKPVRLTVARSTPGQMVLSYQTDMSISDLLHDVGEALPGVEFSVRGHDNVGGLTMDVPRGADVHQVLKLLSSHLDKEAKRIIDARPLPKALEVKPIHLPLVREMLQKMRVHLEEQAAPTLLMKIAPNMTFEDKYTLEKEPVSTIIEKKEWESTVEPLDFSMSSSLILPNQALKAVANDNFEGALGIILLGNGTYLANQVVTGAQLRQMEVPALNVPLQKEQAAMKQEYLERFHSKQVPLVEVPRKAAMDALKFTADGNEVFENTEAIILSFLEKTNSDSYVVLDVEADGAANAQSFNVGFSIFKKSPNHGKLLTEKQFTKLAQEAPGKIRNFRKTDDGFVVNERVELALASQIIGKDGSQPIRVSIKAQNLTNMDQDFIDELGMSAEEAQKRLMAVLDTCGKFVVQAHNLPYDNNIVRVNFPEMYERMSDAIHLDSAPLAKKHQIAYMNVRVNTIDGDEFFNAEHEGYNLSTLLKNESHFDYPSIKGGVVLQVRGEHVQKLDLSTRITTKLKMSRSELEDSLGAGLQPMRHPKYGIEKLLRMATIHDMISRQPLKQVKKVPFDGFGYAELPDELWDHFQENYAYDMTPAQNVAKFSVLPDVQAILEGSFSVDNIKDAPEALLEARNIGAGDKFNPNKKTRSKKEQEKHEKALSSFSVSDILHANAINFVRENPENAERFSRSWVYELVLEHHESTRKDMPKSFINGVSEMTGVDEDMVATIYDEMYRYKQFRGVKSYRVHETHNNVGLEGDVFQEVNVFLHMLRNRLKNPFIEGSAALKYGINPIDPVVEEMRRQAADSTLKQVVRQVAKDVIDDDIVNNYSAKQLDNFSDDGISLATERSGVAKMKCKTLSSSAASVQIELPEYSPDAWRNMPSDERQALEEKVESAVTTLLLANSKNQKSLPKEAVDLVLKVSTLPELIENMKSVQEHFGKLVPTQRESQLKKIMKEGIEAVLGRTVLKMPVNKELNEDDLKLIGEALNKGMERLQDQQNFESFLSPTDLAESLEKAAIDYLSFEMAREQGEKCVEVPGRGEVAKATKAQQTKMLNALGNVLEVHLNACPDLAKGVLNTKRDPLDFLLKSPLSSKLMVSVNDTPAIEQKIDDPSYPGTTRKR